MTRNQNGSISPYIEVKNKERNSKTPVDLKRNIDRSPPSDVAIIEQKKKPPQEAKNK